MRDNPLNGDSALGAESAWPPRCREGALEHYRKVLALRPQSYWTNYRAAGVCYVLGAFAESCAAS